MSAPDPRLRSGPVTVQVPATSANLGPGYDSFGLALDLHDRLSGEILGEGWDIEVTGEGAGEVPLDGTHLVARAMRATFDVLGVSPPGVRLRCDNVIPHGRGLGSSSAAIVGGIMLARALVSEGAAILDDDRALGLATRLEGHPDNVAPALLGGFQIAGIDSETVWSVEGEVAEGVSAVVFVPPGGVLTEVARGLLPDAVPHADAAANAARAGLLVTALAHGGEQQFALLSRATEDFLHQRYREPAMPASAELISTLREQGIPAVVSGAGPTVLAFVVAGHRGAAEADRHLAASAADCPDWRVVPLRVGVPGATVLM